MKIIGLCGGSGSGKGAVCAVFNTLGVPSVDADSVYHNITSHTGPCLDEIALEFGAECVKQGALDRAYLRNIVFTPPGVEKKTARLNSITHKYVIARTLEILKGYRDEGRKYAIIDAPLLFESGINSLCDYTVAVVADIELRIERIMRRDGIDRVLAERRIAAQKSDSELILLSDFVIENNGDMSELAFRVKEIFEKINV